MKFANCMDRKFKVATFILCIGIICFIAFELAGSSVDKEEILNEPFFLIPLVGIDFNGDGLIHFLCNHKK